MGEQINCFVVTAAFFKRDSMYLNYVLTGVSL